MSILSDHIETFIKGMIEDGSAELQRNELAQKFHCAPSQINYVLTTRFSPSRGYIIESRRGGGGYIRVIRLDADRTDFIIDLIESYLQTPVNMRQATKLIEGLEETGFIDEKMKNAVLAAVSDKALCVPAEIRNELRASILRQMLVSMI